ncbi:MAG: tRNA-specific 2-thiouridylase [Candidatus Liptonbacteria bacterium]|nr:tRNA-specific 2-thiouridylase [Candidatus Liptonbacteria bacterium]
MKKTREKVFVGMSGGVDSSVAALLLRKEGYDVVGVFMRSYNIDGCAERDAEDARRVAGKIGIPFYVWDFEEEYKKKVVDYMVEGYRRGLTPNPDVMCNKEIKFGLFLERALAMGADYMATGHYVRLLRKNAVASTRFARPATRSLVLAASVLSNSGHHADTVAEVSDNSVFSLLTARDKNKDQSYFLWTLTQKQLRRCLFPIGGYLKPEVRAIAKKAGLLTAEKKDSQGICFLGKVTLSEFLSEYIPSKNGAVLNAKGETIGEHDGAHFYTIGQRRGLDSGGWKRASRESMPFYVAEKNISNNTIVVAEGESDASLYKKEIRLTDINLIRPHPGLETPGSVLARVRYRQPLAKAMLTSENAPFDKLRVRLVFNQSQKFVAAGQSAVFYSKSGEMLGGGVIL